MRYLPVLLSLLLYAYSAVAAIDNPHQCLNQPEIIILSATADENAAICSAAEQAMTFLAGFDLRPKRKISIEVIEDSIDSHGYIAYGSYDSRSDRISLMSYAAILRNSAAPMMYGEPFDRVHYSGAIAHEVAHAVVQHNLKTELLSTSPQEYLAHATQLAVLPPARRRAIIAAMDVRPWESGDAVSDVYMAMEPGKFAVKSYRHLLAMDDPSDFVEILLNAKWFYVYVP